MQHEGWICFEPADVGGVAPSRQHREPRRHIPVEAGDVDVLLQQFRIPEQWEVVEDGVVPGERHVVR